MKMIHLTGRSRDIIWQKETYIHMSVLATEMRVVFQFVCLGRNLQFKDHPNLRFIF